MQLSPCLRVRQHFPDRAIKNIPSEVQSQLEDAGLAASFPPGASIAIGVGSRGISNYALIVRGVVDYWKRRGCRPFIFPAMGSHGSATAEGQAGVLARAGISEAEMGCLIRSQLVMLYPLAPHPRASKRWLTRLPTRVMESCW